MKSLRNLVSSSIRFRMNSMIPYFAAVLVEYADADAVVIYSDVISHKSMCKDKQKKSFCFIFYSIFPENVLKMKKLAYFCSKL